MPISGTFDSVTYSANVSKYPNPRSRFIMGMMGVCAKRTAKGPLFVPQEKNNNIRPMIQTKSTLRFVMINAFSHLPTLTNDKRSKNSYFVRLYTRLQMCASMVKSQWSLSPVLGHRHIHIYHDGERNNHYFLIFKIACFFFECV